MRYQVIRSEIQFIGHIWQPGIGLCAQVVSVDAHDMENIGEWTRDNVGHWLVLHSGDFRDIIDFRADFSVGPDDWVSPWADPDSRWTFLDCMYPEGD